LRVVNLAAICFDGEAVLARGQGGQEEMTIGCSDRFGGGVAGEPDFRRRDRGSGGVAQDSPADGLRGLLRPSLPL